MSTDLLLAFDDWLIEHGATLAAPLCIIERDVDMIRLKVAGIAAHTQIIVVRNENMIVALEHGTCRDALMWIDCKPRVCGDGVYCRMCDPADRSIYSTHAALFANHLFTPLVDWIKTQLSPLDAIASGAATAQVGGRRCYWRATGWATAS